MYFNQRPILFIGLAACLLGLLNSCANSSTGKTLEQSLSADPKLNNSPNLVGSSSQDNPQKQTSLKLPEDFPAEIPIYPEAKLQQVKPLQAAETQGKLTVWSSSDPINVIGNFYQQKFDADNWQVISQPEEEAIGSFVVQKDELKVTLSIPSSAVNHTSGKTSSSQQPVAEVDNNNTKFEIEYIRDAFGVTQGANRTQQVSKPSEQPESATPSEPTDVATQKTEKSSALSEDSGELDQLVPQSRQYIEDLVALGVLVVNSSTDTKNQNITPQKFEPNKIISRSEYARWLVETNNRFYANRPGLKIRLASEQAPPAFQDLSPSNPNFPAIQGLAEAGLIPSPLSGNATAVLFRPDAPLTRENLLLWKVPLDSRQTLPSASIDAVRETWGFQDAAKIDPKALGAVLADFQNGEFANIRRMLGYTTIFQPQKPVTRAEAAAALWYFGSQGEGRSAQEAQQLKSD
ncbi:MAG: S-layer homology domain-containing protein [Symploca sp. SIO2E9]|nr:S-layer homology domain-containing protein [Symploca sp. SIO2E9]